jgi:hypothetical protein
MMNHRESWAEERRAPTLDEWRKTLSGEDKPVRKRAEKPEEITPEATPSTGPKTILRRSRPQ